MFQKEALPISFGKEYTNIGRALRAFNNTLVFLVEQQAEKSIYIRKRGVALLHTDNHGKVLFRKEMKSTKCWHIDVEMISPK